MEPDARTKRRDYSEGVDWVYDHLHHNKYIKTDVSKRDDETDTEWENVLCTQGLLIASCKDGQVFRFSDQGRTPAPRIMAQFSLTFGDGTHKSVESCRIFTGFEDVCRIDGEYEMRARSSVTLHKVCFVFGNLKITCYGFANIVFGQILRGGTACTLSLCPFINCCGATSSQVATLLVHTTQPLFYNPDPNGSKSLDDWCSAAKHVTRGIVDLDNMTHYLLRQRCFSKAFKREIKEAASDRRLVLVRYYKKLRRSCDNTLKELAFISEHIL
jgi:hypothetical protein